MFKFVKALELRDLVTFVPNKKEPIHNWYYFKEGYSKQLVDILLEKFQVKENFTILDPFCGVGTTLLACKQNNIKSIGFDVSPFFAFVAKTKTYDYDLENLKQSVKNFFSLKRERPKELPQNKFIRNAFPKFNLEDTIFYRNKILEIEDEKIRDFLLLALIDSSLKTSWIFKDGAIVKIQRRSVMPLRKFFRVKVKNMIKDLKKIETPKVNTEIHLGDSRRLNLEDDSIDAVITSPPYLNKIEYTNVYKLETSLFFDFPETTIRSHIGSRVEDIDTTELGLNPNLPLSAKAYFLDMNLALSEIHRVCKGGAKIAVIVGGGCFPEINVTIEVDSVLAQLANKIGFDIDEILVARNSWCTRARTIKIGQIRESIILMKK